MTHIKPILQYPIILVFVFVNLAVGLWAHRKAKAGSFEDYALASRSLPAGVLVMTILATLLSDRELSLMDRIFDYGIITFVSNFVGYIVSMSFIALVIAPRLVFYEAPTLGGVMKKLYGQGAQLLSGIIHCFFSLISLITLIASIGIISDQVLGLPFTMSVFLFGLTVVVYSTLGGMRSVSYTDVLQLILLLFVVFWVTQKVIAESGGMVSLIRQVSSKHPEKLAIFSRPDIGIRLRGNLGYVFLSFYLFMSPPLVHRMLIVKDKSKVSRTWYTSALLYAVILSMLLIVCLFGITKQEAWWLVNKKNIFICIIKYLFQNYPQIIKLIALAIIGILLSTMDSLLHTMGITAIKDVFEPIQSLLGKKKLGEGMQINYARISIFTIGLIAITIGSQVAHESAHYIRRVILIPMIGFQVIITIPFILGVMGLKTDQRSFLSFIITYLSAFYGQKFFFPWRAALKYRSVVDYFLIALPLGLLAYLITHIYINKGIALVKRGEDYTFHRTVTFSGKRIKEAMIRWVKATFNLPELARQETAQRPAHALVFSIFMFCLYGLGSGTGVSKDDTAINFIMSIYFVGICLCVGLMLQGIWPLRLKPYFPLYWLTTLFFTLPLGGTLIFLQAHGKTLYAILFLVNFSILAFLVTSRAFVWMSFLGVALAWATWYGIYGHLPTSLWHEAHISGYIGLAILMICVLFFGYYFEKHISQQLYLKNVFGHAVTHEASQPLQEVSLLSGVQANAVTALKPIKDESGERGFFVPEENVEAIRNGSEAITKALQEVKRDFMHFKTLMSREIGQAPREKVYMKSLIDYIVLTLPKRYTSKVKVRVVCKEDFQAMLIRPFFTNVMVNFLTNAFKHGLATEMVIEIDGSQKRVRVRDNGKGIPDDVLPHIFKFRFTTGDEKRNGVGLTFVKLILDASGVKIETNSKRGEGSFTEFLLTFSEA